MAVLRELIQTSIQIITQAFDAKEDVQTLVDDAERRIFGLAERRLEGSALPVGKILKNTFEYIERLYERKEHVTGVATGFEKLDLETSGFQPSDFIIIAGRPSMGKAQPLDARVKTAMGWTRMGELRLGDALASIDGRESLVCGVFPQGVRQVYRVSFSDGRASECCAEHLWRVHHRAWPEPRVLTTAQIATLLTKRHNRHSLWVDTPSGDAGHSDPLPVDPWLLGALLGAGELSGGALRFWTSDPEILARVAERADGQTASTVIDARRPRRPTFVAVEPTRVTETRCIAVTHPSQLYVTDDHVVTHNTAFALNIVQHVGVTLRGTALVLSLEMSAQQLVQRMLCSEAKVDSQAVRTGFLSSSDWHRLTAAAARLSEAKIFIHDTPAPPPPQPPAQPPH